MFELKVPRAVVTCSCRFALVGDHHDQLVRAATEVGMALELVELALTWGELDYSGEALIPPVEWLEFAAEHSWEDPDTVQRLFSAARDVALRRPAIAGSDVFVTRTPSRSKETQ